MDFKIDTRTQNDRMKHQLTYGKKSLFNRSQSAKTSNLKK